MPNRKDRRAAKFALRPISRIPFEPMPVLPSFGRRAFLLALRIRIVLRYKFRPVEKQKRSKARNPKSEDKASPGWTWFRSLIGPGIAIAGWQVILGGSYYPGVGIIYFGFATWLIESLAEPALRNRIYVRLSTLLVCLLLGTIFTVKVSLRRAPIDFHSYATKNGEYPEGTAIGGIRWNSHFTDLRVWIKNSTDDDYENVYLNFQPDQWNYKAAIVGEEYGCHLVAIGGNNLQIIPGLKGTPKYFMTHHEQHNFETSDDVGDIPVQIATQGGYRLECEKLSARDSIEIVFALVALTKEDELQSAQNSHKLKEPGEWDISMRPAPAPPDQDIFNYLGPRPFPHTVKIDGHYNLGPKPFSIENRVIGVDD